MQTSATRSGDEQAGDLGMHRIESGWLSTSVLAIGLFGCGPSGAAAPSASGTEGDVTATDDGTDTSEGGTADATGTGSIPELDYSECSDPPYEGPDVIDSPDTERLAELLQSVIDAAGYGEAATVEHAQMVSNNAERFCARTSFRVDWYASTEYACWEHTDDAVMQAEFETHVQAWPAIPKALVSLEIVEEVANGCFADIFRPYTPCTQSPGFSLNLGYGNERWVTDCDVEYDVAIVDLVTGELLECGTDVGGGGCEDEG